ncbi:MAG: ATP-binding protein [Acidisphaera sp.]|nr:ATP-binding protein [Acidisphaera sp.]
MITDRLALEIERQRKALADLPTSFEFPLFNSKHALESQRRSNYRNTAAAAREISDNAIEAAATRIDVVFARPQRLKAYQRQDSVSAIAFIDNGSGMLPVMARYALSWGAGTHFEELGTIGKFGFGLPNASINQTTRVEVYTKTRDAEQISMACLDVSHVKQHGLQTIEEPVTAELPDFAERYLDDNALTFQHGTVVLWQMPDNLTYRMASPLREHIVEDFGVVYRYMLGNVDIYIDGTKVVPVDPLFVTSGARYYMPEDQGGATTTFDQLIPVRFYRDPETGGRHLEKVEKLEDIVQTDANLLAVGAIKVKIVRFPVGFAEYCGAYRKPETDEHRRFEIRKPRRGMSFVRAGREIETIDAFPRSMRDKANGLGDWPLLQGYAYHWGIEISFEPQLDEAFGIANDKQNVRPIEDFWKLLAKLKIDEKLRGENAWQTQKREKPKPPKVGPSDEPTAAERAAALADSVRGKRTHVPPQDQEKVRKQLELEAQKRVGISAKTIEEARQAIEAEAKRRPYKVDYFDDPNGSFYEPAWEHGWVVVARVNRSHPFYAALYGELLQLEGAGQAKYSVDVLLLALSKAELAAEDELTRLWYEQQRKAEWSPFLGNALKVLAQTLRPTGVEQGDTVREVPDEQGVAAKAAE